MTCYYDTAASSVCAGGGDFDRISPTDPNCNGTTVDNNATLIKDYVGNCFFRKNFGLNGVVDARQCGIYGDGLEHTPFSDGDLLQNCLTIAANEAILPVPNTVAIVNTGGGVILDNTQTISVPNNVVLTCGENSMAYADNNDYRIFKSNLSTLNLTHAIVIDPTSHDGTYYTLALEGNNSGLIGCLVEAGAGVLNEITGHYPNPYSPSRWYPTCSYALGSCSDTGNLDMRSAIAEYSAFNPKETAEYNVAAGTCASSGSPVHCGPASQSVGITVRGPHAILRNVTVLGFGTCVDASNVGLVLEELHGDCWWGLSLKTPDMPVIRDCSNGHLLAPDPFRTAYR